MQYILETSSLSKSFGRINAVINLEIAIPRGSVFGILGPNGSGKTTTLGMVLGVINPTSGSFKWFDEGTNHQIRKRIGAILESPCFYHYLSATQNLRIVAEIKGVGPERIDYVLQRVGLLSRKDDPFKSFSLGMKQRLAIASALLSDPEVMVLDEPTNGLDPTGIAEIRELIIGLANEGRTIIIASHLLDEVQKICTDFAVLNKGTKIYQGKVSDLSSDQTIIDVAAQNQKELADSLVGIPGVLGYRLEGSLYGVSTTFDMDAGKLNKALMDKGITLTHLARRQDSLERKFLDILRQHNQ
jgi:ABC-2 type transport system ATP-binding protein